MDATTRPNRSERRGVVLVLVLAMLGLLAVIGVSFATFAGQARYTARIYSQKLATPRPEDVIDFGLSQLINDTTNPMSALYGHGLKRDMYGSDAYNNGSLAMLPNGTPLLMTAATGTTDYDGREVWVVDTNIPLSIGIDFSRWSAITQPNTAELAVKQTLEVTSWANNSGLYRLTLSGSHVVPAFSNGYTLAEPAVGRRFVLEGRYLKAFNGWGISGPPTTAATALYPGEPQRDHDLRLALTAAGQTGNTAAGQYANFRISGGLLNGTATVAPFNPNSVPMDEDYDAPDLENWFLAAQSADGSVVIPSFHRPGILVDSTDIDPALNDWKLRVDDPSLTAYQQLMALRAQSKILRPRAVDHPVAGTRTFPDLTPDPATGKITYDVDNDGDGITDSVWLDLGYPAIRSPEGKLYKPLFSFMVLGLNGRIPLNTAGNLNARAGADLAATTAFNEGGMPLFDHASHLGYSPSEINPKYALQNGYSATGLGAFVGGAADTGQANHQFDNTGIVPVDLTQLRNILGGTRLSTGEPGVDPGDNNAVTMMGSYAYLPNNMADHVDLPAPAASATVPRTGTAVPGRFGEPAGLATTLTRFDFTDPVLGVDAAYDSTTIPPYAGVQPVFRGLSYEAVEVAGALYNAAPTPITAGRSPFANQQYRYDGVDDNYDSLDFFPGRFNGATQNNALLGPERGDPNDTANPANRFSTLQDLYIANQPPSGLSMLPSERAMHFVTPIDPTGNGRVTRFDAPPTGFAFDGFGPDRWGRVGFFHYFRPPGVPQREDFFPNAGTLAAPSYPLNQNRLNTTRGYSSFADPGGNNGRHMAAMPYNVSNQGGAPNYPPTGDPTNLFDPAGTGNLYVGTFNDSINSNIDAILHDPGGNAVYANATKRGFPFGGLRFNDPDEMNVYAPDGNDQPFGISDLEWLLRRQDIDGAYLSSRLADLAPVSLVHAPDSLARSRMFTTDSWDRNNYSFPVDRVRGATPSIAQGDRRINLNFPLPHSYDPYEPVRLKWISETYAFLKQVLPLTATDTAEELAELGQFVVNIIDYRDPDNTITIWTNPDIVQTPARFIPGPPDRNIQPQIHLPLLLYDADGNGVLDDVPPTLSADYDASLAVPLVHHGMEYNPIAITEVLGFVHNYSDPAKASGTDRNSLSSRLFIELVNTLTEDGAGGPDPANLDLENWEFVLLKEDPNTAPAAGVEYHHPAFTRPDPFTGQLPRPDPTAAATYDPPAITRVAVGTGLEISAPGALDGLDPATEAMDADAENGSPNYYVLTGARYAGDPPTYTGNIVSVMDNDAEQVEGTGDKTLEAAAGSSWDLVPDPADPIFATPDGAYFWLYLQRPANPLLPAGANNPMVVVDSFRFPMVASTIRGQTLNVSGTDYDAPSPGTSNPDDGDTPRIYSVERRQPFRGGQLVPDLSDTSWQTPSYAYGYSEQVRATADGDDGRRRMWGVYDSALDQRFDTTPYPQNTSNADQKVKTTGAIPHTLGRGLHDNFDDSPWDYFHFNDRDFASVAELVMVPGCPPGMFTKKFVEHPGPLSSPDPAAEPGDALNAVPPGERTPSNRPGMGRDFNHDNAHAHPYLVDKFFYSGSTVATYGRPNDQARIGDGWHRILDVFEVPPPGVGSIGPVAQGLNFDWYREDRRPGQVNLNLVLDEEVFFGVVDDPRLVNMSNLTTSYITADDQLPRVVTQVDQYGTPKVSYPVANRGATLFLDTFDFPGRLQTNPTARDLPTTGMKVAFSDFLKLRHGGSGFLFGHGNGATGSPYIHVAPDTTPDDLRLAAEKPFRSLSYMDINQTLLRPATLPPSLYTRPALLPVADANHRPDVINPGMRNPSFPRDRRLAGLPGPTDRPPPVPPVPTRRLFQIPDSWVTGEDAARTYDTNVPVPSLRNQLPTTEVMVTPTNPADQAGAYPVLPATTLVTHNDFYMSLYPSLAIPGATTNEPVPSLFKDETEHLGQHNIAGITTPPVNAYMFTEPPPFDSMDPTPPTDGTEEMDLRRHPYYRTELLSKMMNLTTPRTHQFAVWVTVGYFEIAEPGDPTKLIPDKLGRELGAASGNATRYRSFFILDRTRATGYDPLNPGDYRDVILYSRRIE